MGRGGGSARARVLAAAAVVAAVIVLVGLFAREPREPAREVSRDHARPSGPTEALETSGADLPAANRSPAREAADRAESHADSLALRGYVLDEAGAPIAGAAVD